MKKLISLCALSLSLLVAVAADRKASGSALDEFTALYAKWDSALVKADLAVLDEIYAKEAVLVDGEGVVTATAEFLRMVKASEYKVSEPVTSDLSVRVYGKTAVASSLWKAVETDKSGTNTNTYRFTDTWVKTSGRWKIVASQGTKLKAQR